jgi:hypothetical protein
VLHISHITISPHKKYMEFSLASEFENPASAGPAPASARSGCEVSSMVVFNGYGTKGVHLISPLLARSYIYVFSAFQGLNLFYHKAGSEGRVIDRGGVHVES